jgi:hypothetical protein
MSTDACQFYYECRNCKNLLRPNSGDCCVFCSFGSVKCPVVKFPHRRSDKAPFLALSEYPPAGRNLPPSIFEGSLE